MLTPAQLMVELLGNNRFDHMSDDVVWRLPLGLWDGVKGAHKGKVAVRAMYEKVMTEFYDPSTIVPEILFLVSDESRAVIRFVMNAVTVWGQKYRNDYCIAIECIDGKIVSVDELFDTRNLFNTVDNDKLA